LKFETYSREEFGWILSVLSAFLDDLDRVSFGIVDLEIMNALTVLLDCSDVNAAGRHHVSHSADFLCEQNWSLASLEAAAGSQYD